MSEVVGTIDEEYMFDDMVIVTFKLPKTLLKKLDKYVTDKEKTRSEVLRQAIKLLLSREGFNKQEQKMKIRVVKVDLGSDDPPEYRIVYTDGGELCREIKGMLDNGMLWKEIARRYRLPMQAIYRKYRYECLGLRGVKK